MEFFDSHAHLTLEDEYKNIDEIIQNAKNANVTKIINVCTNKISLEEGLKLSNRYDFIYNSAATTPHDVDYERDVFYESVEKKAKDKKIVAIGESGLDYFYGKEKKDLQKKYFIDYLKLAKKHNLPLIIHCRDAFLDLFEIVDTEFKDQTAVLHCFTGIEKEAKNVLDRGWYISFSGIITFKNAQDIRDIVKTAPMDRLLIETDSPLLAPQSKRGKLNQPANIVETAQMMADIKNVSLDEIAKITFDNAMKFYFSK